MKFNVAQLLKDPVGSTREYPLDEPLEAPGEPPQPVSGQVRLLHTNRGILARGQVTTWMECTCSRCLTVYSQELQVHLEEEFFPIIDVNAGVPVPFPSGETELFTIDEHHILDLTEALWQDSFLALPMKPLCRADCAGLCPGCGHNLNQGPCQCQGARRDSRWEALGSWAEAGGSGQTKERG